MIESIGIDFGTTNTAASVLEPGDASGQPRLLRLDPSASASDLMGPASAGPSALMKTLLYFPSRKEAFFGQNAIDEYFERDMEGRFLQSIKKLLPNPDFSGTRIHGQHLGIEELVARFLRETRSRIEKEVGSIEGVAVSMGRPARYSLDPERELLAATRFAKACELAGFDRVRFVEEPVAAALTYEPSLEREELILVADLGGGTSDFTLMALSRGGKHRVLGVYGVPVAGDSVDSAFMMTKLSRAFGAEIRYRRAFSSNVLTLPTSFTRLLPKWHHHAFLKERSTWDFLTTLHQELVDPADKPFLENLIALVEDNLGYALHQEVERVKRDLSQADRARFSFRSHPIAIEFDVTREEFEKLLEPVQGAIVGAARETLAQAAVRPEQVDAIYFTGGTSKIPSIRQAIHDLLPSARVAEKDTFTSVAAGLALAHRI